MYDLLFNTPWWLPTSIIAAGIGLFLTGNARQKTRVRNVGAIVALLGVLLIVVSWEVETPKEIADRQTREIIHAVEKKDWPAMTRLLDPKSSLGTVQLTIFSNREDLVNGAKNSSERWQLQSVIVTSLSVVQDQSDITVDVDVLSTQDSTMGRPVTSSWKFDWEQSDKDWKLERITCLKIGDQEVSRLPGLIGR